MTGPGLGRRRFLAATAGSLVSGSLASGMPAAYARDRRSAAVPSPAARSPMPGKFPLKAIASSNGLEVTRLAVERLKQGADTLEAAVAGVTLVENDPNDTSVGYGGLPNEAGVVELDAAVMHGPTHRAGAVAALQRIRNPAKVALKVLERSDHVLLVGDGARAFARAHGFREENLLTEKARKIWLYWKENLSKRDDWLPPADDELDPDVATFFKIPRKPATRSKGRRKPAASRTAAKRRFRRPTGTVHCATMNAAGDISCTTSTSGLAFKIPGRVGDSPIVGAGLYVDNAIGSCGSTGRGEANLQNLCCFAAVELMRGGASPEKAGMAVLERVAGNTEKRLRNDRGRPDFGLTFYLLDNKGRHAGVTMWGPGEFAVTDAKGTRKEKCKHLYRKRT